MRSAAVPCIGALIAARSAPARRGPLAGTDVRQAQPAAEHRLDVALLARELARALHVRGDAGIAREVALDVLLRAALRSMPSCAARPNALMP